ncbi:MAG: hypothetical protein ACK2UO_22190 [Caldilineaceae bacterium]|jgi:hypothetical protein
MRANVKSFTYWVMHKGYAVRFRRRSPTSVDGILTTPEGEQEFEYNPSNMTIRLPGQVVTINQGGWEIDASQNHTDDNVG